MLKAGLLVTSHACTPFRLPDGIMSLLCHTLTTLFKMDFQAMAMLWNPE